MRRFAALFLIGISACSTRPAGEDGAFDVLLSVRGQYPATIGLWSREPLHSYLKDLLGRQYPTFLENIEVASPVTEEHGVLFITGNRLNGGAEAGAVLLADPEQKSLRVSVWDGSTWIHHSNGGGDIHIPHEADKFYQRYLGIDTHGH
ncbi:MAG: hypothetical protein ACKV22_28585 [Bryobacteraceae bacterium]